MLKFVFNIKFFFLKLIFANKQKVIIASSGRCGSTLLTRSIIRAKLKKSYLINLLVRLGILNNYPNAFIRNIEEIPNSPYPIIKTHGLINNKNYKYLSKHRVIFIFGDPLHSLYSVNKQLKKIGKDWVVEHLKNLGSYISLSDLNNSDSLNYANQLKSWENFVHYDNIFYLNFKSLWDPKIKSKLENFLDIDLEIDKYSSRKFVDVKYNKKIYDKLIFIYTEFDKKISNER